MMQVIRGLVIFVGLAVCLSGLFLLLLGLGAPIEIRSIELGIFKTSLTGIGSGFAVAAFGLAIMFVAMRYLKRSGTSEIAERFDERGNLRSKIIRTTTKQISGGR